MAKKPIIRYFDRGVWYDATVSDIGNLEDLNTVHKTTVVEAINDIIGGNINISGELLEKLTALDNNISRIDGLIASGSLNETQANQMNKFVTNKLNELSQSMEELNKQRDQRLKEQEEKVAQLKLDSESDRQRIEEITGDLNATKEKLNNAELNVTSVTQLVDEINGKISQAVSKTDFDLLEGTVREHKTLIDQTAEGIKLLATKEELDKTNENVKSIKSEVDVQAGLIESKVSSEQLINEMEKIDKYMPNLLRYTRNWQDWENDDEANIDVTLNEYRDCIIQRARGIGKGLSTTVEYLVIGETYSLSVWVKHDDTNAKLYAMVDNEEIVMTDLNSEETFVGNDFKRMRCSFVAQDTTAKVRFIFKNCRTDSYGYLAGAKCEKNKKVSGWQPNSEDVYKSIKSARSEIKQTDDKITTLVETVTQQGDLIASHTTSIEETDKAITLQAESIKTLNESIESAKAELKVSSDAIKSKVWKTDVGEMISDINIDNKNRVLNSDFGDGWELWSETNNLFQLKQIGNYKFAVAERSGLSQNMAIAIATNKFPVKHNERLMFGFYFYCADLSQLDNKIVGALELLDINDIKIDRVDFDVSELSLENGSFTKLTDTYFVEDERIVKARLRFFLNRNGNIGFALPMAQGGDIKSSDWSLAPEDVARRFNDTNVAISNYEQTVNGFKQTVESYKGSVDGYTSQLSEFNQTRDSITAKISTYEDNVKGQNEYIETLIEASKKNIELSVSKNEIINAINLSTEGVSIDGSKLEINAETRLNDDLVINKGVIKSKDGGTIFDLNNNSFTFNKPFTIGMSEIATKEDVDNSIPYNVSIYSTKGYSFKNGIGETTLTARVMDGPREVTNEFSVNWYRENDLIGPDASITVQASSINEKVVYRIIAYKDGIERGRSELTLINVNDGKGGKDGTSIFNFDTNYQYKQSEIDKYGTVGYRGVWNVIGDTSPVKVGDTVILSVFNIYKQSKSLIFATVNIVNSKSIDCTTTALIEKGEVGPPGLDGRQGEKGDQGIQGRPGVDGRTSYAHIAYADSADGTKNFSVSDSRRLYIGFYTDFNQTDSTNPSAYRWTLIKGADGQDGADGLPGKPGADGRTPYFHTAYADSADGQLGFSTTNASGKLYMGTCTDYIQSDPTDYRAYTWVKIKGEKGDTGATGPAGRDGKGVKGYKITYQAGTSGVSYPTGSWSSTIPNVPNGQYLWSKTTLTYTDNTTSDTYSVAYFPVNGATGATGNGISSYTAEFYLSTSKTTQSGGSWTTTPPTWSNGKYIWTRYKIGYTNGSTAYTTPNCSSEWEAVNDVQKNLDAANQNIAKKVDQEAYDNDKQVIYDDISKKLDDEEFRKFQKTMNDLKSSYERFVGEGGRYEKELQNASKREQAIVQNLGEKVQQLNFINTYIRESEEGIVIGAKGNPMQMLLSKDSLSFMDGGQVVAYFSNQSFYINRGAVVDSLQVGVHKMTRINNEFTVIQYVPN